VTLVYGRENVSWATIARLKFPRSVEVLEDMTYQSLFYIGGSEMMEPNVKVVVLPEM
jgi:hypothetical protein